MVFAHSDVPGSLNEPPCQMGCTEWNSKWTGQDKVGGPDLKVVSTITMLSAFSKGSVSNQSSIETNWTADAVCDLRPFLKKRKGTKKKGKKEKYKTLL